MIKAILFDMDGLLIDSELLHYKENKIALKEVGFDLSFEEYIQRWQLLGTNTTGLLKDYNIKCDYQKLRDHKNKIFSEMVDKELKLMPGVIDALRLVSSKYLVALVSSAYPEMIDVALDKFNCHDYFKIIISNQDVTIPKPHPQGYLKAAYKLGVKPEECVVFEDSIVGTKAAKAAGMKCVLIPNKYLEKYGFPEVDLKLKSLTELTTEQLEKFKNN